MRSERCPSLVVPTDDARPPSRRAAAFGDPRASLQLVGVTGTNGKTTTVDLLRHLLDDTAAPARRSARSACWWAARGGRPGGSGSRRRADRAAARAARARRRRVRRVAMEVSSHSLDQRRVDGVAFEAAVFTNFTRDHLDYHGTMDAYFAAKARLVEYLARRRRGRRQRRRSRGGRTAGQAPRRVRFSDRRPPTSPRPTSTGRAARQRVDADGGERTRDGRAAADRRLQRHQRTRCGGGGVGARPRTWQHRRTAVDDAAGARATRGAAGPADGAARLRAHAGRARARARRCRSVCARTSHRRVRLWWRPRPRQAPADGRHRRIEGGHRHRDERQSAHRRSGEHSRRHRGRHARQEPRADRGSARGDRAALAIARPGDVVVLAGKGHETYQIRGTTTFPFDEREIVQEIAAEGVTLR